MARVVEREAAIGNEDLSAFTDSERSAIRKYLSSAKANKGRKWGSTMPRSHVLDISELESLNLGELDALEVQTPEGRITFSYTSKGKPSSLKHVAQTETRRFGKSMPNAENNDATVADLKSAFETLKQTMKLEREKNARVVKSAVESIVDAEETLRRVSSIKFMQP